MAPLAVPELAEILADYDRLVEVGIGERTAMAASLVERGSRVTATDVVERAVPPGVAFVVDDVTDPDPAVYRDADAIYSLRLPPELQRPALAVARAAEADLLFTTLGGDPAVVPATPRTVAEGTCFVATRN
ncbi:MAG: UPF0146 family protein [Halanaeroarchaeum sp.]